MKIKFVRYVTLTRVGEERQSWVSDHLEGREMLYHDTDKMRGLEIYGFCVLDLFRHSDPTFIHHSRPNDLCQNHQTDGNALWVFISCVCMQRLK